MRRPPIEGRVERFHGDQLVVDLEHLDEVRRALDDFRVRVVKEEQSQLLKLALLSLDGVDDAMDELDKTRLDELEKFVREFSRQRHYPPSKLDLLLWALRDKFASRFGGWTPTIGKNRVVEQVKGFPHIGGGGIDPHIGGGGGGDPTPVRPSAVGQRFGRRASEPGRGVRIAVLDTRLYAHPFLLGGFVAGLVALDRAPATALRPVSAGHATFVAGLILKQAPGAQLELHPVLNRDAAGDGWEAAKRMAGLARSGVQVLNLSWGGYTDDGQPPLVLSRAVERVGPEVVIVAAAGNHGDIRNQPDRFPGDKYLTAKTPIWPAALDAVVAVDAEDSSGTLARFSPRAPWVNLVACGVDVESTYLDGRIRTQRLHNGQVVSHQLGQFGGFALWSGTSFAAATVSGLIAADTEPGHRSAPEALRRLLQSLRRRRRREVRLFAHTDLDP